MKQGDKVEIRSTARKVFKFGVISSQYFPVFSQNTGRYGPKKLLIYTLLYSFTQRRLTLKLAIIQG